MLSITTVPWAHLMEKLSFSLAMPSIYLADLVTLSKKNWGIQEDPKLYDVSTVPIRRLSPFIHKKVDYLKIDVERAEFEILTEIQSKLHLVKQLHLELLKEQMK